MRLLDVVELVVDVPDEQLAAGAVGTVVEIFDPPRAYEVEFVDQDGRTIALVVLTDDQLALRQ